LAIKDCLYDNTVDESQQPSLEKALAIFEEHRKEHERKISERIKRPNISIIKGLFILAIALAMLFFLLPCVLKMYIDTLEIRMIMVLIASMIFLLVSMHRIIVWLILVYQKRAPKELRLACVFEPTCSEYMLKAIDKYGVWRGVNKGIGRLFRCHPPNGGKDEP